MKTFASLTQLEDAAGTALGPTEWVQITQDRVDMFADATDDHQWIHTDPDRAAEGPFGATIAHGLLTLSLLPRFMHELYHVEGVKMAINYGFNKIRFITPVPVGTRLRARSQITEVARIGDAVQATMLTTIEIKDAEKPAAVIESIIRYIA
jgi:acyl dehydratase